VQQPWRKVHLFIRRIGRRCPADCRGWSNRSGGVRVDSTSGNSGDSQGGNTSKGGAASPRADAQVGRTHKTAEAVGGIGVPWRRLASTCTTLRGAKRREWDLSQCAEAKRRTRGWPGRPDRNPRQSLGASNRGLSESQGRAAVAVLEPV
jgi:hypothetical protein